MNQHLVKYRSEHNAIIKPTTIPDNALSKNLKIYNRAQDKKKT